MVHYVLEHASRYTRPDVWCDDLAVLLWPVLARQIGQDSHCAEGGSMKTKVWFTRDAVTMSQVTSEHLFTSFFGSHQGVGPSSHLTEGNILAVSAPLPAVHMR